MASTQSECHSYVNVLPTLADGTTSVVDYEKAPVGKPPYSYINVPFKDPAKLDSALEEGRTIDGRLTNGLGDSAPVSSASIDVPTSSDSLTRHSSLGDTRYNVVSPRRAMASSAEETIADAKLRLLMPGQVKGCENCDELSRLLAMWEIGVSGLTRNYSRILAHLIKIRNASMALEFRLKHTTTPPQPPKSAAIPQALLAPPSRATKNRQSMFVNTSSAAPSGDHDIAVNMYPDRRATAGAPETDKKTTPPLPAYAADIDDLNGHLEEAIDLCQQLAAACFKTNHLSELSGKNASPSSFARSGSAVHHDSPSTRKYSAGGSPSANLYKPSLQSIAEIRLTGGKKRKGRRTLERTPSAPNLELSGEVISSGSYSESDLENSYVKVNKEDIPDLVTKPKTSPGEVTKHLGRDTGPANGEAAVAEALQDLASECDSNTPRVSIRDSSFSSGIGVSVSDNDLEAYRPGLDYRPESVISSISTYSDSDVKCVMSKIASLEEERYKLLETINALQEDNSVVRVGGCEYALVCT